MKVTHNNKEYILDPAKAIELGVLKEVIPPPPPLRVGDVYERYGYRFIILQNADGEFAFGLYGGQLRRDNNKSFPREEMVRRLTEDFKYIGNISDDVQKLVAAL